MASRLAEAGNPIVCPPQWLPMLMALHLYVPVESPMPPPSPPPPSPSPSLEGTVVLTLTASGSVNDFSDNDKLSLQQWVADAAGVDKSLVTINVTAASVRITATIAVPASMSADEVQTSLASTLGTAAAASAALGLTIEEVPTIVVLAELPPPSPSLPPSPSPPSPSPPPPSPSPPPLCVDADNNCKKRKCQKYDDEKNKRCKKTCGSCEGQPPSAPPPPPVAPAPPVLCEDNDIPGFGSFWCELNTVQKYKERFCNTEHNKNKCKKSCGLCDD